MAQQESGLSGFDHEVAEAPQLGEPGRRVTLDVRSSSSLLRTVSSKRLSRGAERTVEETVDRFASDLLAESARGAEMHDVDTIDEVHVKRARAFLFAHRRSRLAHHVGMVGGNFFGASASAFCSMALAETWPPIVVVASAVSGLAGVVMMTVHVTRG